MSRAYRKWKERMKECRRTKCVYVSFVISDPKDGISLSAYRKHRRARQRAVKAMRKIGFKKPFIELSARIPGSRICWKDGFYQVSEAERARQANEYGRQSGDLS